MLACEHQQASSRSTQPLSHFSPFLYTLIYPSHPLSSQTSKIPPTKIIIRLRRRKQSCTDPTFTSPLCTHLCTAPGTHALGFADVLQCADYSNRWYCGIGNTTACASGHTFQLRDGYLADFRGGKGVDCGGVGSQGKSGGAEAGPQLISGGSTVTETGTAEVVTGTAVPATVTVSASVGSNGTVGNRSSIVVPSATSTSFTSGAGVGRVTLLRGVAAVLVGGIIAIMAL